MAAPMYALVGNVRTVLQYFPTETKTGVWRSRSKSISEAPSSP